MPQGRISLRNSAFEFFCLGRKFLVYNLVNRNLKVKYRRSLLGILWTLLAPLAMAAVYYLVFGLIIKVKVEHYLVHILTGVLLWQFFAQTLIEGLETLTSNWALISRVPVPIQIFPYVGSVTNLINLLLGFPVILAAGFLDHMSWCGSLILIPYLMLCLFLITYGFSLALSIAYVFLRDMKHFISIVLQLWFYGTPVFYDEKMIPPAYHFILYLNPVSPIIVSFHDILVRGVWPDSSFVLASGAWAITIAVASVSVLLFGSSEVAESL
ncbi:MAG: ABC transporter permease [Bdellovibrionota bacterium]